MIMVDCIAYDVNRIYNSFQVIYNEAISDINGIMERFYADRLHRFAAGQQKAKHQDKD